MQKPESFIEIFLQPGEVFFGDSTTRIRTILGSCVSITFWHPTKLMGGMTHIMLPERGKLKQAHELVLDGKYADEAMRLMLDEIESAGTQPSEYQVKLFGGGDMFSKNTTIDKNLIGEKKRFRSNSVIKSTWFFDQCKTLWRTGSSFNYF